MNQNNIVLDFCAEYDDKIIYKFITEELFNEKIDDVRIEGMNHCFIYEEFYPNHEYDLKRLAKDFFEDFIEKNWNKIHAEYQLFEIVKYKNKKSERNEFIKILLTFKDSVKPLKLQFLNIELVKFDIDTKKGIITGNISYQAGIEQEKISSYSGNFKLHSRFNDFFWAINEIHFPGFK